MGNSVDDQVIYAIWNSQILIKISLAGHDDYYFKAYRNQYFPVYYSKITEFYSDLEIQFEDIWLEYDGVALKWNYPIGLLHDYILGDTMGNQECWKIDLRLREYPEASLLPIQSVSVAEAYWMNQIKQACHIQNGSSKKIMNLSKADSSLLWQHVLNNNGPEFERLYSKILPKMPQELKRLPVKIYILYLDNDVVIQEPIENVNTSLRTVLNRYMPQLFSQDKNFHQRNTTDNLGRALIHGITVDIDVPLTEMYYLMRSLDGFLHVCVIIELE